MKVLLIDDDLDDADFFCRTMSKIFPTIECIRARSGDEAMMILKAPTELPSYIFLDGMLHGMSSKTCLTHIINDSRLANITVVIYSGYLSDVIKEDYLRMGAKIILIKPSGYQELKQALKEIITVQ